MSNVWGSGGDRQGCPDLSAGYRDALLLQDAEVKQRVLIAACRLWGGRGRDDLSAADGGYRVGWGTLAGARRGRVFGEATGAGAEAYGKGVGFHRAPEVPWTEGPSSGIVAGDGLEAHRMRAGKHPMQDSMQDARGGPVGGMVDAGAGAVRGRAGVAAQRDGAMRRAIRGSWSYERRSRATVLGVPLFHVVGGRDPLTGRRRMACGIVAIGQFAVGIVAIGQVGAGVVAIAQLGAAVLGGIGQMMLGVAAVAQLAATVLAAVGQLACGWFAVGQLAAGLAMAIGQGDLHLDKAPGGALLVWTPVVVGWAVAARVLRSMGQSDSRWRHARQLPRLPACGTAELRAGPALLRGTVAHGQGVLFDASDVTPVPGHRARFSVSEFLLEDAHGKVLVTCSDAELFIAGRGRVVTLQEGDAVEVLGTVRETPDAAGSPSDYRRAPTRFTMEATTIAAHQTMATVRAMARFPGAIGWLMGAAAVLTAAASVAVSLMR